MATKRFYIPEHVRAAVNDAAEKTGLPPGAIVEGAVLHLIQEHSRTGQPIGPTFRAMVERAKSRAAR